MPLRGLQSELYYRLLGLLAGINTELTNVNLVCKYRWVVAGDRLAVMPFSVTESLLEDEASERIAIHYFHR